jgi:putative hydrolase of the HAD superfamily
MPRLPTAILFDLDDTLIAAYGRPDLAWQAVVAEFAGEIGPLSQSEVVEAITAAARAFWADAERHRLWRQDMRAARREIVRLGLLRLGGGGYPVPDEALQHRLADRFSTYRNANITLYADAHATLDALRGLGVKLALITNGAGGHQRDKIERFDLARRFDHIQIEGEQGFGKPEPRAYTHAMAALGVAAHETWIVGDNLEWEVIAPQKLGLHAIWYDPLGDGVPAGHAAKPDRIVRTLTDLLA